MLEDNPPAPVGHNHPPGSSPADTMTPDALLLYLHGQYPGFATRLQTLEAALGRFMAGKGVTNDEDQGRADAFARQFGALEKQVSEAHADTKRPFLDAGRAVDAWKSGYVTKTAEGAKIIRAAMTTYAKAKEARVRAEAKARADELAAAAQRAQDEAQATATIEAFDSAIAVTTEADKAEKLATAGAADLTRVRSDFGTTSSLRRTWGRNVVVTDPALVPQEYWCVDMDKLRAKAREDKDAFNVPGVVSTPDETTR